MAEKKNDSTNKKMTLSYRGRLAQIGIYFAKFLRMFIYQSDWTVLPMTALIAGVVGFVMGKYYMVTINGTMTGTFALVCVCIWNGCFNSIQVICREREVVKREHRAGMHISSYVISHMLYQFILCLLQTIITIRVISQAGMKFPEQGLFTKWFILDFGFTILLITYAADMMSLWISSLSKSTTTAMTIMPFVLVFQLIFSGGVITIPEAAEPVSMLTVSCPGFKAMASQADVNNKRNSSVSKMVFKMKDEKIPLTITLGRVLDILTDKDNEGIAELRAVKVEGQVTAGEVLHAMMTDDGFAELRSEKIDETMTVGQALTAMEAAGYTDKYGDTVISYSTTFGELVDVLAADESVQERRDESITVYTTVGEIIDEAGRDKVKKKLDDLTAKASYNPKYECSKSNIIGNWLHLLAFIVLFSALTIITLEFIDKDKR